MLSHNGFTNLKTNSPKRQRTSRRPQIHHAMSTVQSLTCRDTAASYYGVSKGAAVKVQTHGQLPLN